MSLISFSLDSGNSICGDGIGGSVHLVQAVIVGCGSLAYSIHLLLGVSLYF